MIVVLNGRSLLCAGLASRLAAKDQPVVSVPLSTSLGRLATTLHKLQPAILILDASDILSTGLLFLDALREEPGLAGCPVLIVAGGTLPDAERFRQAAARRGLHVLLDPVGFEQLAAEVESLIDGASRRLASVAD